MFQPTRRFRVSTNAAFKSMDNIPRGNVAEFCVSRAGQRRRKLRKPAPVCPPVSTFADYTSYTSSCLSLAETQSHNCKTQHTYRWILSTIYDFYCPVEHGGAAKAEEKVRRRDADVAALQEAYFKNILLPIGRAIYFTKSGNADFAF